MKLVISVLVFLVLILIFFPAASIRAMILRKKLMKESPEEKVRRKGILERFNPLVQSLMLALNIRISHQKKEFLQSRLNRAGYQEKMSVDHFITFKVLSAATAAVYFLFLGGVGGNPTMFFLAAGFLPLGYKIPDVWLSGRIKARQEKIRRELPYALNAISILADAGTNLFPAIQEVAEKQKGEFSKELTLVIRDVNMGVPQGRALEEVGYRCQVDEVSRFVSSITQNLERGSAGITETLRLQAAEVWERRKKHAQQLGEQASMKLFLPLVLLAFPAMMIFMIGPVVLSLFDFFQNGQ
ncbi:type II secretion system F family protein [Salibacterium halotolerans]|uniref:Tight adherence protein C n=1 Tax=Salibacterium halotolerans TaxID=1884432 RepID=A0A1I5TR16_9BACI|nr:type II secretion system F family protein [Salibacterium halotolerans]SFP85512.1 tight adherence protein C [Salibacterium halotolerans]